MSECSRTDQVLTCYAPIALRSTPQIASDDEDDTVSFRPSVDVRVAELVKQVRM